MWNCNGSASPAVFPERRVLPIVTLGGRRRDGQDVLWPRVGWVHIKGGTSDLLEVVLATGATRRLAQMTVKRAVTYG